ncbi:ATP-binding cassette domain-containing protein [Streptomyces sp. NPDC093249]|uniref:ABC transporter ATP-binding protein n=1 Tax=unclassified Streptomyces TaxID=2593676 RepID=UPI003816B1A0
MRLERVGRRHGSRGPWVLREVVLDLPAAALVRVVGANGSGKSTLLRLLAGVDAPTEGRIEGRPVLTAYVPERFPAALPFTAVEYLVHLGRLQGLGRAAARAGAGEWLERLGAAGHARTPMAELSKGTSQKVAVVQALLAGPGLLVLDEAWTGLDAGARTVLDTAVRERRAAGATVVFVDHDPRRLAGEADAVYEVAAGRVSARPRGGAAVPDSGVRAPGRVRIVASGGSRPLPGDLPGAPLVLPGPGATTVLTVAASHSDTLLGALLASSWHIERLEEAVTAETGGPETDGPRTTGASDTTGIPATLDTPGTPNTPATPATATPTAERRRT